MTVLPTAEKLRTKARECRAEAEKFQNPEIRKHRFEIADVYERMARAAEAHEAKLVAEAREREMPA
jgi:hypothetical protein